MQSILLLLTFIGFPLLLTSISSRFLDSDKHSLALLLGSFCIGPQLLTWAYITTINYTPVTIGQFQITALIFIVISLLIWGNQKSLSLFKSFFTDIKPTNTLDWLSTGAFGLLLFGAAFYLLFYPVTANDPLEYLKVAELININGNSLFYPILSGEHTNGFVTPWTHFIGFPGLISLISGGATDIANQRIVGLIIPFYMLLCYLALVHISKECRFKYTSLAGLLLATTPLLYVMALDNHIDFTRVFTYFASLYILSVTLQYSNKTLLLLLGGCIASSYYIHSSGITTLATVLIIYFLFAPGGIRDKIKNSMLIGLFPALLLAPQILLNFFRYGHVVGDLGNISSLASHDSAIKAFLEIDRNISTIKQIWLGGVLKGFSNLLSFGFNYWILLGAAGVYVIYDKSRVSIKETAKSMYENHFIRVCTSAIILFYGLVVLTVLLGSSLVIKNDRYLLQIMPIVCFLAVYFINLNYNCYFKKSNAKT